MRIVPGARAALVDFADGRHGRLVLGRTRLIPRANQWVTRRIEMLANNFAAGLLMPKALIEEFLVGRPLPEREADLPQWLREGAGRFQVSGSALKWQMKNLKLIPAATADRIDDALLRMPNGEVPPPRFSRKFVDMLGWGISEGALSIRKAANVAGISIDELAALFGEHGLQTPFDL